LPGNWALNKCQGIIASAQKPIFFERHFTKCELKKGLHISYFIGGGGGKHIVFEIKTINVKTLNLDFKFRAFF
jgi:hypothetical protein